MTTEQKLREALEAAQLWHNRSDWRFGTVHQREAWDAHRLVLAEALTQPPAPEAAKPETERPISISQLVCKIDGETRYAYQEILRLVQSINYMVGIAERGRGSKCPAEMSPEKFLLDYVKEIEAAALLSADSKAGGEPVAWETRNRYCPDWVWCSKEHFDEFRLGRAAHGVEVRELYTRPQQQAKPLTEEQKRDMWKRSDFRGNGGQYEWYLQGIEEAERAHGIGDQS